MSQVAGPGATSARLASRSGTRAYAIINFAFLIILGGGTATLATLEVTDADAVRIPWLNRELPATCYQQITNGTRCPSCGITRSLITATHGDFERSRQFHRAGIAVLVMLLAQCAMRIAFLWRSLRWPALDVVVSAAMLLYLGWLLNGG